MLKTTFSAANIIKKEQLAKATALHTKYMLGTGVLLVLLVIIGTAINTIAPFSGWNALIAMLLGLVAVFLITKPTALAIVFLATSIGGLPNLEMGKIFREGLGALPDFQSNAVFRAGVAGIEKWFTIFGYIILSMMLFHLVLEFVPFHGKVMLVFTVLAILEGLAIREYLYYEESTSKYYKKWTLYLLLIGLLISIIRVASLSISGEDIRKTVTAIPSYVTRGEEDWQLVEVIDCQMGGGEQSWNKNLGWCAGQSTYEAGSYRFTVRVWDVQLALWDKTPQITGYTPIPNGGISLDQWSNTPFENEFLRSAPIGGNRRIGSLIARIGNGKAFEATEEFEINPGDGILSISLNLPQSKDYFAYNQGMVRVEVERVAD